MINLMEGIIPEYDHKGVVCFVSLLLNYQFISDDTLHFRLEDHLGHLLPASVRHTRYDHSFNLDRYYIQFPPTLTQPPFRLHLLSSGVMATQSTIVL